MASRVASVDRHFSRLVARLRAGIAAGLVFSASPSVAATVPTGFVDTLVASGLANPTAMQFAPDGRLFVCEQSGQLRVIKDGALVPTPFATVSVNDYGERGLLGVAFDPNFATNQYVYVITPSVARRRPPMPRAPACLPADFRGVP